MVSEALLRQPVGLRSAAAADGDDDNDDVLTRWRSERPANSC